MKQLLSIVALSLLTGCGSFLKAPQSIGERNSGFTYIPLDPLPVAVMEGEGCQRDYDLADSPLLPGIKLRSLLDSLPDNAVRVAIKQYDVSGKITYGPASVGTKGGRYQVVLDYINVDTENIRFYLKLGSPGADGSPPIIEALARVEDSYVPDESDLSPEELAKKRGIL